MKPVKVIEVMGVFAVMIMAFIMIFKIMDNLKNPSTVQSILISGNGLQKLDTAYSEGGYPAVQSKVVKLYKYLNSSRNTVTRSNGAIVMTFSDEGFSMKGNNDSCKALNEYIQTHSFNNQITFYADNNKIIHPAECPLGSDSLLKISFTK